MIPVFVKICGITEIDDATFACKSGASGIGCILYEKSVRNVSIEHMSSIFSDVSDKFPDVLKAAVTVNAPFEQIDRILKSGADVIQLHGHENQDYIKSLMDKILKTGKAIRIWKAASMNDLELLVSDRTHRLVDRFLLDSVHAGQFGGTGKTMDWHKARDLIRISPIPVLLSGGITADNAAEAIKTACPAGIDLSSGVESSPGKKDKSLISKLFNNLLMGN